MQNWIKLLSVFFCFWILSCIRIKPEVENSAAQSFIEDNPFLTIAFQTSNHKFLDAPDNFDGIATKGRPVDIVPDVNSSNNFFLLTSSALSFVDLNSQKRIWSIEPPTNFPPERKPGYDGPTCAGQDARLRISKLGDFVVTASYFSQISLVSTRDGKTIHKISVKPRDPITGEYRCSDFVTAVDISTDSKFIVVATKEPGVIKAFDTNSFKEIAVFKYKEHDFKEVGFFPDGKTIFGVTTDSIMLWDFATQKLKSDVLIKNIRPGFFGEGNSGPVDVSDDMRFMLVPNGKSVFLMNLSNHSVEREIKFDGMMSTAVFVRGGRSMLAVERERNGRLVESDLVTGKIAKSIRLPNVAHDHNFTRRLALSKDKKILAVIIPEALYFYKTNY